MSTPNTDWAELTEDRLVRLESAIAANTALTHANAETTQEIREILETGKALFRFASGFGRVIRWLSGVISAGGVLWAVIYAASHGGKPPGGH